MYMLPLSEFSCLVERWDLDGRGLECGRDLDGEEASPICVAFALTCAVIMSHNLLLDVCSHWLADGMYGIYVVSHWHMNRSMQPPIDCGMLGQ